MSAQRTYPLILGGFCGYNVPLSTFWVLKSCAFSQPQRDNSQALWLDFSFRVISNRKLIQTNRSDFGSGRNPRNECRTGNVSFLLKEGVVQVKPEATGKMPAS